ncbi:sigma-54-dependent Fis family transcriptional regulator [Acidithiobacillus marinus]|uniref:Sigma-54-dependent Fis family transcriptional regulator n=1 Tax=Acidithiobacillus marinus TaxID=187490 RepID=A0A2I1DN04_9PROT|nr:sigma-54 dependent transcriptional regulator [Acidithiobacillus marinus]PKY11256.1 sigma-54-dependent Fis family transcriptional regulator [Acidithiobacillus marinus]
MGPYATRILLVEDDEHLAEVLQETLEDQGYQVQWAEDGTAALRLLADASFDLVLSDVQMRPMDGYTLLKTLGTQHDAPPLLMMTAWGTIAEAVQALQNGAVDYLVKPFTADVLLEKMQKYAVPHCAPDAQAPIAQSEAMQATLEMARKVAPTDASVLLMGESGVGKEVLARFIHEQSRRQANPFVAVNCAAIPESLLEATLFGHEKGAFTGATQSSAGKFEQAQGGTLLLDEVTEMPIQLQAKLLRVLQERELERVGGKQTIVLDIRLIATSNRDLRQAVAEGVLREDLYYRLQVFPLQIPPLRERQADILPLAEHLLRRHCQQMGLPSKRLGMSAKQQLYFYDWPGNVRELENALQRALILAPNEEILAEDLCVAGGVSGPVMLQMEQTGLVPMESAEETVADEAVTLALDDLRAHHEREAIALALRQSQGSKAQAAERLGISPRTLRHKIQRFREAGYELG